MLEGMNVPINIVSVSSGRRKNLDALRTKSGLQTCVIAENILNKQWQVTDKWWFSAFGFVRAANDIWTRKMQHITKWLTVPAGFDKFWRSLEINIKMDLEKTWDSMDWIAVAQERDRWPAVVNTVMNIRVA